MAGNEVEEIRNRVSLEDLIRDYSIQLLPSGGHRLRALCPFHHEKTPSFYVNVEKQFYHCFGCKEGGDIFNFVQKMDHVSFPEALEILARRAGVTLHGRAGRAEGRGEKVTLFDALAMAEEHYHRQLIDDPRGEPARRYLEGRGIHPEMWKKFRLGYALPEWDGLLKALAARRVAPAVLERAGLVRAREGSRQGGAGYYDYFRGRIMFPIADAQRRVIGFGARTLGHDEPKYLNTPKTALFEKGQVLYALPQARNAIHAHGRVAIMEGYTDVIMAHQQGFEHAVASLGTAFTAENARRLRRLAGRVDLIFDGDAAGQGAAERSLDLLVAEELDVRVYTITTGKDPCDALLELGGEEFRRRLERDAVDVFEYKWARTVGLAEARGEGPVGVARALDEVAALLGRMPNVVARKLQARRLAERLNLDEREVNARVRNSAAVLSPPGPPEGAGASFGAGAVSFPRGSPEGAGASFGAGAVSFPRGSPEAAGASAVTGGFSASAQSRAAGGTAARGAGVEEVLLECLLAEPELARERLRQLGALERAAGLEAHGTFSAEGGLRPAAGAIERRLEGGGLDVRGVLADLQGFPEARQAVLGILARLDAGSRGSGAGGDEVWRNCLRELERKSLEQRSRALDAAKQEARASGDESGYLALQREQLEVLRRLKSPRPARPDLSRSPTAGRESEKGIAS